MGLFFLGLTIGILATFIGCWYGSYRYLRSVDR